MRLTTSQRHAPQMATLLRNPFHAGVLDKRPLSPRPRSPAPSVVVDFAEKPSASHKEHTSLSSSSSSSSSSSTACSPSPTPTPTPHFHLQEISATSQAASSSSSPRLPPGSWDSHMHIIDPERYPLSPTAIYQPSKFTVTQALAFESSLGAAHLVLVQPSIYGHDNACLLDALARLGGGRHGGGHARHARGVVAFDPDPARTPPRLLQDWHRLGVRGVRLNLQSTAQTLGAAEMAALLHRYAAAVRPLGGWVIQLYIPLSMVTALERIVPTLGVRVVIDHMGSPEFPPSSSSSLDPYALEGFPALARLLQGGHTYVKMSAPYRLRKRGGKDDDDDKNSENNKDYLPDVEPVARELLRLAGRTRVVFATDWPHTRFEGLNIRPWIEQVMGWCDGDQGLVERVFKGNAEDLWA